MQNSKKGFRKLQEAIWLTVINQIFKSPPLLDPCGQENYLYKFSSGYPSYPTQKSNIWTRFESFRKGFRKLQEAIWLTVINEIFKFSPHLDPFGQENYYYKFSSGYPNYPTQNWYIWTNLQTSKQGLCRLQEIICLTGINEIFKFPPDLAPTCQMNYLFELPPGYPSYPTQKSNTWISFASLKKEFCKLQEIIWLIVINAIFEFPSDLDPFGQENYFYKLFSDYPNYPTQKWYIWTSFQCSRKGFRKLQEAIWLTVINKIITFPPHLDLFGQENYFYNFSSGYPVTQLKNYTFGLVSRLIERDFVNYRKPNG